MGLLNSVVSLLLLHKLYFKKKLTSLMKNLFSFPSNHFCNLSCNPHFQIIEESVLILLYEVLDRQLVHLTGSTASSFLYHFYQHTQILVDFIYIILVRLL